MTTHRPEAAFVVIEGLDGAGTTTQARMLVDRLREEGHRADLTREPSDGPIGVLIRQMLSGRVVARDADGEAEPMGREVLALLFAADRLDHVDAEIAPAVDDGRIVVSDRYYHSSLAYQADGGDDAPLDLSWVRTLNQRARTPDLTVFLEASVDLCLSRMSGRSRTEMFETRDDLTRLERRYETVMTTLEEEGERIVRLDAARSREELADEIFGLVYAR
ncbi:MAG: dTMP kinase [Persicimonas sp.]